MRNPSKRSTFFTNVMLDDTSIFKTFVVCFLNEYKITNTFAQKCHKNIKHSLKFFLQISTDRAIYINV